MLLNAITFRVDFFFQLCRRLNIDTPGLCFVFFLKTWKENTLESIDT